MIIKNINGINVLVDSRMEFLLGIHSAYLRMTQDQDLDWVESPSIHYVNEIIELIDIENKLELQKYIKYAWESCDEVPKLALIFDENFDLIESNLTQTIIDSFKYGNVYDFAKLVKKLTKEIKWNDFIESKKEYFANFCQEVVRIPINIDLNDLFSFYGYSKNSYNYIISALINGGFLVEDQLGNVFCISGFQYDEEEKSFDVNDEYLIENLFHEFSHSYVNPIVDKYFAKFTNLETFANDSLNSNMFNAYTGRAKTMIIEYIVRANANILQSKYTGKMEIHKYYLDNGFTYLQELVNFINNHRNKYPTFEDFFVSELIDYINALILLPASTNKLPLSR